MTNNNPNLSLDEAAVEWVDTDKRLSQLCEEWSKQPCIAVDTEFVRTDTFYPILGLIQVSDGETCWLVDPLAIEDMLPLAELLVDNRVVKIFHACSEDLEVLQHSMGVIPKPIIDTQLAAAFVGFGFSKGYAALVGDVLGITLDKHETRSDWLQRPLTEAQQRYGAEDVYYLVHVYHKLIQQLEQGSRLSWVETDMKELVAKISTTGPADEYYLKIKGAWQLRQDELAILKQLACWREHSAREQNKPRNRIVSDRMMLEVAKAKPKSLPGLQRVKEMHPRVVRQYGDDLLELVEQTLNADHSEWPSRLPKPLPRESGVWLKQLRAVQEGVANEIGVAREILARKKDIEEIVQSAYDGRPRMPEHWQGTWRDALLGQPMLAALPDLL
ncbi:ribonuclease D [Porticoccaceae bacterium LTM1]|nr:ribonuclease D [Porticoccaceae bacterium LTM1]